MLWWWIPPKKMRTLCLWGASPHPPRAAAAPLWPMTHTPSLDQATTHPRSAWAQNRSTTHPLKSHGRSCTRRSNTSPLLPCQTPSQEAASAAWGEPPLSMTLRALAPIPKTSSGTAMQVKVWWPPLSVQVLLRATCSVNNCSFYCSYSPFLQYVFSIQTESNLQQYCLHPQFCFSFICSGHKMLLLDNGRHIRGNSVLLHASSAKHCFEAWSSSKAISITAHQRSTFGGVGYVGILHLLPCHECTLSLLWWFCHVNSLKNPIMYAHPEMKLAACTHQLLIKSIPLNTLLAWTKWL